MSKLDKLVKRLKDVLSGESVVFATLRDPIVILPLVIRNIFYSLVLIVIGYCFNDVGFGLEIFFNSTGIITRVCVLLIFAMWIWFLIGPYLKYQNEILAFTKGKYGNRAIYVTGFWGKRIIPIKMSILTGTPVRQDRAYYQTPLKTGDLKLATIDDSDIFFSDMPEVFSAIEIANSLT